MTAVAARLRADAKVAGLAPSYPMLVLALMVTGLGNSAFHPADFAILNAKVDAQRLGYAFSAHGPSGNIGFVLAPLFAVSLGALTMLILGSSKGEIGSA